MGGRSRSRLLMVLAAAVMALGGPGLTPAPAAAQESPTPETIEICSTVSALPELGGRLCAAFEAGSTALAAVCQQLDLPPEVCSLVEEAPVDPAEIDAYEDSWTHRALRLQEQLDRREPLINSLIPHTHNSANSTAYGPSLSTYDPNQRYTIGDQLRMDIRGIELDLHWVLDRVVLCHGTSVPVGDLVVHVGCSIDQPLANGLGEIRDFLTAPGNEDVVVLLYLENQLDGDATAHAAAVADLEAILGDLVDRPPTGDEGDCVDVPMDRSRQDVLDAGAQIVIVGNCGPGPWRDWVHERGPRWNESGYGGAYSTYPDCIDVERTARDYDGEFIRHWEDLTFVSALANGTIHHLDPDTVHDMVRCGVDMIGFDRLEPSDGRLEALVWSWASDEPATDLSQSCAFRGADARFRTGDCTTPRPYACRTGTDEWIVPETVGAWSEADAACADVGATFAVPPTGWQNERLGSIAPGEVWIALGAAPPAAVARPSSAPGAGADGALPATGGPVPVLAAVAALVVAMQILRESTR